MSYKRRHSLNLNKKLREENFILKEENKSLAKDNIFLAKELAIYKNKYEENLDLLRQTISVHNEARKECEQARRKYTEELSKIRKERSKYNKRMKMIFDSLKENEED